MMQKIIWSKKLIRNICQLLLGAIMLFMSYNYVQAHDAEKTNFISGMTVLKQKVTTFFESISSNTSSKDIDSQQEMLRNYKELASYLTQSKCEISIPLSDINDRTKLLEDMTPAEYKTKALSYGSYASQVYTEMQEKCKK